MNGRAWQLPEAADAQPTYFSHALALAALHGPGPWPDGGYPLPDEDPEHQPLMVGSVLDGVRTHHFGSSPAPNAATRIADLIADLVTGPPSLRACAGLHAALADQPALEVADALGHQLRHRDLPADRVRATGRWLAEYLIKTALRNPVIRCRNVAIRTLSQWPAHSVPADADATVRDVRAEPEPGTRESLKQLLSTWDAGMMT